MSENERQTQNRPTRRSVSSEKRAVGTVRPRSSSSGRANARTRADSSYSRSSADNSSYSRSSADNSSYSRETGDDSSYYERPDSGSSYSRRSDADSSYSRRSDTSSRRAAQVDDGSDDGVLSSLKGAIGRGREAVESRADALTSSEGDGPIQKVMSHLPESDWIRRGVLIVALLIAIIILFNLVTCVAGAITGGGGNQNSQASAPVSSEAAASSDAAAQQQGVSSPWTADGTFTTGDNTLDTYIKNICDGHSTEGASFDSNAYETYLYVSRTDYVERSNNQSPWGEGWDVEYAKQYFEEGQTGNCFNYAAVVEYILKYFGYSDAEAEPCVVGLESGDWGDHGLVFVTNKIDNKRCLIDSSLSANGWMLDADSYQYDIRNIGQNSTIQGNVDVLNDNDTPTRIPAGELTEPASSASSASAESANTGETEGEDAQATEDSEEEPVYIEETAEDEEVYYDESEGEETGDEESEEEDGTYYEESEEEE